jgi:hypothetical protein
MAAAIGSIIEFLKARLTIWTPRIAASKTFQQLILPLTPYVIGGVLYVILTALQAKPDIIQLLLSSSLADTSYRILKNSYLIYEKRQAKDLNE